MLDCPAFVNEVACVCLALFQLFYVNMTRIDDLKLRCCLPKKNLLMFRNVPYHFPTSFWDRIAQSDTQWVSKERKPAITGSVKGNGFAEMRSCFPTSIPMKKIELPRKWEPGNFREFLSCEVIKIVKKVHQFIMSFFDRFWFWSWTTRPLNRWLRRQLWTCYRVKRASGGRVRRV